MAKTCPSCGYSAIGPFTDNCPICAEPVRNVRSDEAGVPGLGSLPLWVRWVIAGAVVGVLGVGGCCVLGMWGLSSLGTAFQNGERAMEQARAEAEASRRARTVVVAAADLLREFQDDPAAADRKYRGKYLQISGVVERVGKGGDAIPFIILHAGDENAKLRIECFFDYAEDEVQIRQLGKGQPITVRGEYDGQVSNLQVRECVLVK